MLYAKPKKEALAIHERAVNKYNTQYQKMEKLGIQLYERRQDSVSLIHEIEFLVNSIANRPKEFEKKISDIPGDRSLCRRSDRGRSQIRSRCCRRSCRRGCGRQHGTNGGHVGCNNLWNCLYRNCDIFSDRGCRHKSGSGLAGRRSYSERRSGNCRREGAAGLGWSYRLGNYRSNDCGFCSYAWA